MPMQLVEDTTDADTMTGLLLCLGCKLKVAERQAEPLAPSR